MAAVEESYSAYNRLKGIEIIFEAHIKVDAKKTKETDGKISSFDRKISGQLNDAGSKLKRDCKGQTGM